MKIHFAPLVQLPRETPTLPTARVRGAPPPTTPPSDSAHGRVGARHRRATRTVRPPVDPACTAEHGGYRPTTGGSGENTETSTPMPSRNSPRAGKFRECQPITPVGLHPSPACPFPKTLAPSLEVRSEQENPSTLWHRTTQAWTTPARRATPRRRAPRPRAPAPPTQHTRVAPLSSPGARK